MIGVFLLLASASGFSNTEHFTTATLRRPSFRSTDDSGSAQKLAWKMRERRTHKVAMAFESKGTVEPTSDADFPILELPGRMRSASLYILEVMALPEENALAVTSLGRRRCEGWPEAALDPRKELEELPVEILGASTRRELNCSVLPEAIVADRGWSCTLLCSLGRAEGRELRDLLRRTSQDYGDALFVKLGGEVARVSPNTLSAATRGHYITRAWGRPGPAPRDSRLRASVVVPLHGSNPPYLHETIMYFRASGLSHVYLGLFKQQAPGRIRAALETFMQDGFVSVLEIDEWSGFTFESKSNFWLHEPQAADGFKELVNDWALFHAKSYDDLLLVHDYDELFVPVKGESLPAAVEKVLLASQRKREGLRKVRGVRDTGNSDRMDIPDALPAHRATGAVPGGVVAKSAAEELGLRNLCYLQLCAVITYGPIGRDMRDREGRSRAEDFPFADGGESEYDPKELLEGEWNPLTAFCSPGGYINRYAKAIAVVHTTYKTSLHQPGSCSAVDFQMLDFANPAFHENYINVSRDDGLFIQHFSELFVPGRYVPGPTHRKNESVFSTVWGPRVSVDSEV